MRARLLPVALLLMVISLILVHPLWPGSEGPAHAQTLSGGRLSAGGFHTCAIDAGGMLKCWGANYWGQVGDGTIINRTTPVSVMYASSVAAGYSFTCALPGDGTVKCWGNNQFGQLGDASTTDRYTPVAVSGITNAVDLYVGYRGACALLTTGGAKCWGNDLYGQLGDGATVTARSTPVAFGSYTNIVSMGVGIGHTCAVLADGTIRCVGLGNSGQLGNSASVNSTTFVQVTGVTTAKRVYGWNNHTCAVLDSGAPICWGSNAYGQLGDNTTTGRNYPVSPIGLSVVLDLSVGVSHSCAITDTLEVYCWGLNTSGQTGTGQESVLSPAPLAQPIPGVMDVSCGGFHTAALSGDANTIYTWGASVGGAMGEFINTILLEQPAPTATAAPLPTPGYQVEKVLSSGDKFLLERRVSYGEIGVISIGMAVLVGIVIVSILNWSHKWLQ